MAIQISGCTVIDNSRNITNANNMCVGVVTMTGSSGNIETPGTITAAGLISSLNVISFNPADGATVVDVDTNIIITFDQQVQKGTGNITLRNSSGIGTIIETIAVSAGTVTISGAVVTINPVSNLPFLTNVFVVVDAGAFTSVNIGATNSLIDTYDFTTTFPALGDSFEGGFLICLASPLRWVVAPSSSQVSRSWYSRNDANTRAQQVSGCTGWFVPSVGQLQNPGYVCRTFWDSFNSTQYWSSAGGPALTGSHSFTVPCTKCPFANTPYASTTYSCPCSQPFSFAQSCDVSMSNGSATVARQNCVKCIRAFRCVTY